MAGAVDCFVCRLYCAKKSREKFKALSERPPLRVRWEPSTDGKFNDILMNRVFSNWCLSCYEVVCIEIFVERHTTIARVGVIGSSAIIDVEPDVRPTSNK